MILVHLALAFLVALTFTLLLMRVLGVRGPGPWQGFVFFFVLLFVTIWAGGVWLAPIGPQAWDVAWMGFLVVGLLMSLLLAALVSHYHYPDADAEMAAEAAALGFGLLFYLVTFAFIVAALTRYFEAYYDMMP